MNVPSKSRVDFSFNYCVSTNVEILKDEIFTKCFECVFLLLFSSRSRSLGFDTPFRSNKSFIRYIIEKNE